MQVAGQRPLASLLAVLYQSLLLQVLVQVRLRLSPLLGAADDLGRVDLVDVLRQHVSVLLVGPLVPVEVVGRLRAFAEDAVDGLVLTDGVARVAKLVVLGNVVFEALFVLQDVLVQQRIVDPFLV